jgi:hypothetical protein
MPLVFLDFKPWLAGWHAKDGSKVWKRQLFLVEVVKSPELLVGWLLDGGADIQHVHNWFRGRDVSSTTKPPY